MKTLISQKNLWFLLLLSSIIITYPDVLTMKLLNNVLPDIHMVFLVVCGMDSLLLSTLSECFLIMKSQCMHKIITVDYMLWDSCLGSGGWGFFGSKGASKVRSGRVNFQSQRFDKAEIVE